MCAGWLAYLGACEDGWRDNLVRAEGLSRVDEGGEDFAALFALRWWLCSCQFLRLAICAWLPGDVARKAREEDLHDRDDGRGLWIPMAAE